MFILKSRYNELLEEAKEMHDDNKALREKIESLQEKVEEMERELAIKIHTSTEFDVTKDDLVSGKQFFCLGFGKRTFIDLNGEFSLLDNKAKNTVGIGWVKTLDEVLDYMKKYEYRNIKG